MASEKETGSRVLEDVFQNVRKAAEANLKLQQEMFQQWSHLWPTSTPQSVFVQGPRLSKAVGDDGIGLGSAASRSRR